MCTSFIISINCALLSILVFNWLRSFSISAFPEAAVTLLDVAAIGFKSLLNTSWALVASDWAV